MIEPCILYIDSSGKLGQVGLSRGELLIHVEVDESPLLQSKLLNSSIRKTLRCAGVALQELNAIAVVSGPGSFTGLRIGVSTAKGLCYGLNVPLIGVSALELELKKIKRTYPESKEWIAVIPAGKGSVHGYGITSAGRVIVEEGLYEVSDFDFWQNKFPNAAFKSYEMGFKQYMENRGGLSLDLADMSEMAVNKYYQSKFEDLAYFEPLYITPFQSGSGKVA